MVYSNKTIKKEETDFGAPYEEKNKKENSY